MNRLAALAALTLLATPIAAADLPQDLIPTSAGNLTITFVGHGTLIFEIGGTVIHVDPFSRLADYATMPDADLVLITHAHRDHLDADALTAIRKGETRVIVAKACAGQVEGADVMANGERRELLGLTVEAVPAYNLLHMRSEGVPYHPKGEGNGYVLGFGDTRVYIAGDTENVPEMKNLKDVAVAFLPMNLPYTMTPEMVADAVLAFKPRVLYPYHYGETDTTLLLALLEDHPEIEVRVRDMK